MKMMVFKRKQIVVLSLVLMIIVAGYLQYMGKASSTSISDKDSDKIGEAVYVDNSDSKAMTNAKAITASKQANDFFAQAKLDRQITRDKDTESLKGMNSDNTIAKDAKTKAMDKMIKIVDNSQREMRIETLIKEKGFQDAIALFGDDGSVDIIIKTPNLTSAQVASISDIVSRQANIPLAKMQIKQIF